MAKKKAQAPLTPEQIEAYQVAEELMLDYEVTKRNYEEVVNTMKAEQAELKLKYAERIAAYERQLNEFADQIKQYCLSTGEKKVVFSAVGEVALRKKTLKIEFKEGFKNDEVCELISQSAPKLYPRLTRTKVELDKDAVKKAIKDDLVDAIKLNSFGIEVIEGGESINIKFYSIHEG